MDFLSANGRLDGGVAVLEDAAAACLALSQTARCSQRCALQRQGLRCAAAAARGRAALWRDNFLQQDRRLHGLLDRHTNVSSDLSLEHRARRVVALMIQNQGVLSMLWLRRPSLTAWTVRAQAQVRAERRLEELADGSESD